MKPEIINGDCRHMDLDDESIQCVVTSPPYWRLRKYAGEQEINDWGCAFGLEKTPELYVQHTAEILREIRRVLRKDGVVFWVIGDSYAGSGGAHKENHANPGFSKSFNRQGVPHYGDLGMPERYLAPKGLKPKDLCLIPFRVAIALQGDGWWVRSVIAWSKNNSMPESVTDRPTNSHEYILMLTKSGNTLFWTHPRKRAVRAKPKPDYCWKHKHTGLELDYQPVSNRILKEFWSRYNLWQGHDYYWDAENVREGLSIPDAPRTTAWTSLGGATLRMELDATVNTDGSLATLWGRSYFGQPEIPVNLAVTLNAEDLQIGGVVCSSIVLEQPERDFVMDLENCVISRDTTHFTPITSFGFDKSPDFIPVTTPIVNSTTSPSSTVRSCKFTSQPERNALPTTKVMARLNIISVTPELITAVITLEDNPLGASLLICGTFTSTHTNNIIPQSTTGRNIRSVWSFPTFPYPLAHFATFPEKLPEICIKAATSEKGRCSKCGAPWVRVIDRKVEGELEDRPYCGDGQLRSNGTDGGQGTQHSSLGQQDKITRKTVAWRPSCKCNAGIEPCVVLDPFCGSGTTLVVANKLGRSGIGYEISVEYCDLAKKRIGNQLRML